MNDANNITAKWNMLAPLLNERDRRLFLGAEAACLGYGGVSIVSRATGVCRETVAEGVKDVTEPERLAAGRIRRSGAGRKKTVSQDSTLMADLESLVDPLTRGDPESPLRWTCKSTRKLAAALNSMAHKTSHRMVAELLQKMDYSLQGNKKTLEGSSHPDRNAQFEFINDAVGQQLAKNEPAISVDAKKKESVGNFKNSGREYRPKGDPEKVKGHDFPDPELGKVTPYGVYDQGANSGWVSVGTDHDTAAFAVETIRRWWYSMGQETYPNAKTLLITADSGGSNGRRVRLWKTELQRLSDETGLKLSVCHFPPGTSKWNKIEHRLFSFITQNWRGRPLISHEVIVNLIASTRTEKGLTVRCEIDNGSYPKGLKIKDKELKKVNIAKNKFHGEWNYTISPEARKDGGVIL
jgi:hypothetical protein